MTRNFFTADSVTVNPPTRVTSKDLDQQPGGHLDHLARLRQVLPISDELRQRILAVADEAGYRPNAIARSLNQRRSGIVALVVGDLANPFFPEVLEELSWQLRQAGRQLLLFVVRRGGDADELMPQLLQYQVDVIVLTAAQLSWCMSQLCQRQGALFAFTHRRADDPTVWSVCCDNKRVGEAVPGRVEAPSLRLRLGRPGHLHHGRPPAWLRARVEGTWPRVGCARARRLHA